MYIYGMTSHRWAVFVITYIWEDLPPFVFLHPELLPICCTESRSRSVAPRAFNALPVLCHALQRHAACIGPVWFPTPVT